MEDLFQCKVCNELVNIAYREFILTAETDDMQFYEICCTACAHELGQKVITDQALREVLGELSFIVGTDASIRLAAPSESLRQHGVGPEDLEADITDQTQPHQRRRKGDERFYNSVKREINNLRNRKEAEETPEHRCKSNEESQHKFPLRSNYVPSEVPDSIEDYWNKRRQQIDEWAKYRLNPDGTFSKNEENN